jgi:hypothetical protein
MPIPDIGSLEALPGPYEILELGDGGLKDLTITNYIVGKMVIHPRPQGASKAIVALRVFVPEAVKSLYPDYYDITSQTLIAQLLPYLEAGGYNKQRFTIRKTGMGPQARFSLQVSP